MGKNTPIISVVGYSNSGKTTYLERLIPELSARGYKVCAVKHDVHNFDIDIPGKDSYRLKAAGAHTTLISSPEKIAIISDVEREMKLTEIRDRLTTEIDIIVTEGYKSDIHPKIEVFRKGMRDDLLCKGDDTLFAVAADTEIDAAVPVMPLDDAGEMADLIVERFLKNP
ncbi:MAG: molybdopterin-guanine dinucleotide biosynthesis protein B [Deltaproteobacteria bacterium]|uniref:Molybdopterin-guanine dinucleotide biosynthesis protein B n=1 Tax=Candidatus Zymogenus saltonus TaxID=2844893 RepID=A0A9D8KDD4_9DELT|nr:molybdopterin-guanine dinucleotide biosynthesis protein B [Candidatus Zymogenus saltonus]